MTNDRPTIRQAFPVLAHYADGRAERSEVEQHDKAATYSVLRGLTKVDALGKARDAGLFVDSKTSKEQAVAQLVQLAWNNGPAAARFAQERQAATDEIRDILRDGEQVWEISRSLRRELASLKARVDHEYEYLDKGYVNDSNVVVRFAADVETQRASLRIAQRIAYRSSRGVLALEQYLSELVKNADGWSLGFQYLYTVEGFIERFLDPEDAAAQSFIDEHVQVINVT